MKPNIRQQVTRRLKIVEGQIRGLQKMVADDVYCVDIISQTAAVKNAISGIEDLVLENHLSTHVVEQMKAGKEHKASEEILQIYRLSKKR